MNSATSKPESKIGLVLPGGGARAAYQTGVLRAIAHLMPKGAQNPFKIITGTSAGAFNATALAIHAQDFRKGVLLINKVWKNFHVDHVFRADTLGVMRKGGHWLLTLMGGGLGRYNPDALLDREPLNELFRAYLPCERIQPAIDSGALHALGITASSYRTGHSVTFFQGHKGILPWDRQRRVGVPAMIDVQHLLASSAIPFIFAAERINNEYFGDGSIRQIAPISPALHLGADKVLVVGIRKEEAELGSLEHNGHYPSLAEIAGHILDSIFLDSLDVDIERVQRINKTLSLIPDGQLEQGGIKLRPVEFLTISPSRRIDLIAKRHDGSLPLALRFLLRGIGAYGHHGATLLSYLLFEQAYCRELIALGYKDAMQQRDEILKFLDIEDPYLSCRK